MKTTMTPIRALAREAASTNSPSTSDAFFLHLICGLYLAASLWFGTVQDQLGPSLCRKLHSIGWVVSQTVVVRSDIDYVADEVERWKSTTDMVLLYGGVGPHSDITLAGVAKAFGVRLAPDEEYEEYLRYLIGDQCTSDRNERYFGTAIGKGRQAAKTEIEKLKLSELTCRQGIIEVAKMVWRSLCLRR